MDALTRELRPPKPWEIANRWGDTWEQIEARQRALWRTWRNPFKLVDDPAPTGQENAREEVADAA